MNAELDELQRQHARDRQRVADMAAQVEALASALRRGCGSARREQLDDAVRSYASFVWEHLGREEGVILPAAQRHLRQADWSGASRRRSRQTRACVRGAADGVLGQLLSHIIVAAAGQVL